MANKIKIGEANIGISEENKQIVSDHLNRLLANEFFLYTKTRKFHWNVEGSHFKSLHLLFEDQYNEIAETIDAVAERIRKLGHYALGSFKQFSAVTDLIEHDGEEPTDAKTMLLELCDDHETIIRILRNELIPIAEKYKDLGTNDFLTGVMEMHETMAWMLRATAK
ncbi:DNA starvation/stationary phase protection protein [Apibacter muscae]|uniref:DNA starvation/stationary phase protection protein n=1 Tax=Apibacter muscae TaxID=2509004 RepID=A0A563DAX8_9FLAO|nr:DNA starvation/stationary phase protection protein [Apibacter muscae]TWP27468.1 DNA starvation/stationary phase protection protein [Apibacter muscae]TWP28882.1 DNA starvation/stationary phase protection protein [Apibacter muscae]